MKESAKKAGSAEKLAASGAKPASRRKFGGWMLKAGLGGLAAFVGWEIFENARKKEQPDPPNLTVDAAGENELQPNSAKEFVFGSHEALLIRLPDGGYRAMTAVCTHQGCIVRYLPSFQQIWCPCHKGIFDLNGNVVSGPPPRPLKQYLVEITGGQVMVSNQV